MKVRSTVVSGALALGLASALWACHEQKPRPITDCGDSCTDGGVLDASAADDDDTGDAAPDASLDATDAADANDAS